MEKGCECSTSKWWLGVKMVVEVVGDRSIQALFSNKGVLHWIPLSENIWEEWEPGGTGWC